MPEDEFLGLMDICDVFDLIWLEEGFAASKLRKKLGPEPRNRGKTAGQVERPLESDILDVVENSTPCPSTLKASWRAAAARAHDTDENPEAGIMLEKLVP